MGLNGADILLLDRDMRLLTVVVEDLLVMEDGEGDLGVDRSELEEL